MHKTPPDCLLSTFFDETERIIQEALEKVDESAKVETLSVTQKKRCHLDKQPNEEEITEANML